MIATELPPPAPPAPSGGARGAAPDEAGALRTARELRERLRVEEMLSRIASALLAHAAFGEAMRLLGEETASSRAYLYRFAEPHGGMRAVLAHGWCAPGVAPEQQASPVIEMGGFGWCRERFLSGEPLVIPDAAALGEEAAAERAYLGRRGIGSLVLAPLRAPGGGELLGFIGIDTLQAPRVWSGHQSRALAVVAFMVSGTLARAEAEEALRRARAREQYVLSASPNVTYVLGLEDGGLVPVWVSPNLDRMLGHAPADAMRAAWWMENLHPEDREPATASGAELLAGDVVVREFRIRHRNGSWRWIRDEQRMIRDALGNPVEVVGSWADITARRHVEDAQREQANLLRALLDSIPVPIYCKDPQGLYFDCNDAFAELVGRPREEILWRATEQVLPADVAAEEAESDRALLAGGGRDVREIAVAHAGGARAVIQCRATFRRGDGTLGGIVGTMQDITPRKRAEEALAESERHFRSLIENSADLIAVVEGGAGVTYASPSVERVLGFSPGDVLGRGIVEFVHPDDAGAVAVALAQVAAQPGAIRQLEYRCRDRWGAWRTLEGVVQNRTADAGGVVINARDVTERQLRDAELRDHTAALRNAVEGIARFDPEGRVVSANQAYADIVGADPASLAGTPWTDAIHPDDRARVPGTCGEVDGQGKHEVELRVLRRDGTVVFARTTLVAARDQEGRRTGCHCFMKDVTGWNQLNAQLQRAQKLEAIGQLAAGVAHEINTPVQYVGDNVRFLRDALADLDAVVRAQEALSAAVLAGGDAAAVVPALARAAGEAAEAADVDYLRAEMPRAAAQAIEGLERVAEIVRAMKEFSHPGTAERSPVDLNRAIQSTLTVARNEWKYVAELVTDFDAALPPVPCLPGDFNQVVLNLVVNAAHAIAEKNGDGTALGTITVGTRRDGEWAEVRVADTGNGIPEPVRGRIFDPFFTTKPVGRGTGQGLTLAHAIIVEKHGGTLHFQTETGRGTTFIIRLPLHAGREAPAGERA